jgi:hypothetical protein
MVTSLVEMREDNSDTRSTVPTDRSSRRSSVGTSLDSQYRIPPRPPMREMEGLSSTMSTALPSSHTGGKGVLTQWVHCEFIVGFETIRPVVTHQVLFGYFLKDTHQFAHILPTGYMVGTL